MAAYPKRLHADRLWGDSLGPGTQRHEYILELSVVDAVEVIVRSVGVVLLGHVDRPLTRSPIDGSLILLLQKPANQLKCLITQIAQSAYSSHQTKF